MIKIDLREGLVLARKAFDAQQLQAQKSDMMRCLYAGPCIIGSMLPQKTRDLLDEKHNGSTVNCLATESVIAFPDEDQLRDAQHLQHLHDDCAGLNKSGNSYAEAMRRLREGLEYLEQKYGLR